jgi:hypothetical protein
MERYGAGRLRPAMGIALGVISSGVLWATAWECWRLFLYLVANG